MGPTANVSEILPILRGKKLSTLLGDPDLPESERTKLFQFLTDHHEVFSVEDGERGETELVEMDINTGDFLPIVRRMPFSVRQEVARQLREMQDNKVIEPPKSPLASSVWCS